MDRCLLMVVAMLPSETNTLSDSATLDLLLGIYEFIIHSKKKTCLNNRVIMSVCL